MLINPQHWPILSRLLDEALEMPPEGRDCWLEALPSADVVSAGFRGNMKQRTAVLDLVGVYCRTMGVRRGLCGCYRRRSRPLRALRMRTCVAR